MPNKKFIFKPDLPFPNEPSNIFAPAWYDVEDNAELERLKQEHGEATDLTTLKESTMQEGKPLSQVIRERIQQANTSFRSNDNISEFKTSFQFKLLKEFS